MHWFAPTQALPLASCGTHSPPKQSFPALQSPSVAQPPRQVLGPHANVPQLCCCKAGQLPLPLQVAPITATPPSQVPGRQLVSLPG